ncbi:hypothetical protein GALL_554100 [mine drainage metagenome]|uniref:Uncharacterized protein n=1 Tax=mine drainage metagenome TaxID=410659 RepID=A0A1J5NXX7_9ZZZZ
MHEHRAEEDEVAYAGFFGGAREMQRTLDIDVSIKFDRMLFVLMMDTCREMNHGVCIDESGLPVGRGTKRIDHDLIVGSRRLPYGSADDPTLARQPGNNMPADEAGCARDQDDGSTILHERRSSSFPCNNSATRPE